MALIVGHCAVGARRQSNRRQSAERENVSTSWPCILSRHLSSFSITCYIKCFNFEVYFAKFINYRDNLLRQQLNVCDRTKKYNNRLLLHSLHWLPVRQQVTYKVALLTQKVQTTATPTYLSELVQTHASPRALHSSDAPLLVVPRIQTELARRAFSVAPSI